MLGEAPVSSGGLAEAPAGPMTERRSDRGRARAAGQQGPGGHSSPEQRGSSGAKGLRQRAVGSRTRCSLARLRGGELKDV